MKIISKRNGREIILLNTGYSGRNTCIVSREGNSFSCKCLNRDRLAECDVSQLVGDVHGACCPLYYMGEEELEHLVLQSKI